MEIDRTSRAYRRALTLGLTLAEIFVLILFVLLLAFGAAYQKERRASAAIPKLNLDLSQMRAELDALRANNALLIHANQFLKTRSPAADKINDLFRDLMLCEADRKALKAEVTDYQQNDAWAQQLREALSKDQKAHSPQAELQNLADRAADSDRALAMLRNAGLARTEDSHSSTALKRLIDSLHAGSPGSTPAQMAERLGNISSCASEKDRLQGEVVNLEHKLSAAGQGTQLPPCWTMPDGKPEYIFNVTLTSTGLLVHDNQYHHAEETQLIGTLPFDKEIDSQTFLDDSEGLYDWGKSHQCGFFVRVFDATKPSEKVVYKVRLQTVEAHFYKLLSAGSTPPSPAALRRPMTDQKLEDAILRLRAVVLDKLARRSGHVANDDVIFDVTPPAPTDPDSLKVIDRENLVRSRWKSFVRWFYGG